MVSSPQNENDVINYSSSCRSKPMRPSFVIQTQIKIGLIKSESSLTLHRQQRNCNVPRSRNIVRISVNFNFPKLQEYFLCAKKTKIITLFNNSSHLSYRLPLFWRVSQCIRTLSPKLKNNAGYADCVHVHASPP